MPHERKLSTKPGQLHFGREATYKDSQTSAKKCTSGGGQRHHVYGVSERNQGYPRNQQAKKNAFVT